MVFVSGLLQARAAAQELDAGAALLDAAAPYALFESDAAEPITPDAALLLAAPAPAPAAPAPSALVVVVEPRAPAPDPVFAEDEAYAAQAVVARPAGPGEFAPAGTGSRVNAPLEELPNTVDTVTSENIRERGVSDLSQALSLVPGVVPLWSYGGFLYIQSRGFQAVTLYDGRRDPRAIFAESAPQTGLFDLDRIELVRGPTSVLYGYGAIGGAVNMIRNRASSTPRYELELGIGTPRQYRAHADAQGAITPKLSYRVDLGHHNYRNFRGYRSERSQVTSTLRYTPTPKNTFNVRVAYAFDRYNTDVGIPTVEDSNRPGRWVFPAGTRYDARYNTGNDFLNYQRYEAAVDYRYDFDKATYFEARGSIFQDDYSYLAAESLTYVPGTGTMSAQVEREYLHFRRHWRPITGSAELHSDLHTGPVLHQLVLGYGIESFTGSSDRMTVSDDSAPGAVDFVAPVDNAPKVKTYRNAFDHYRTATHSIYGLDHVKLSETLILTGGVRVDILRSRTRREYVDPASGDSIPDPSTGQVRKPNYKGDLAPTGQVGLVYNFWKPVYAYVSYGTGYKPQFVSPSARVVTRYNAEKSEQFEGGLRLRVERARHELKVDAAGYLLRKRNLLVPRGVDDFVTAGLAQSRGLDLTVHYQAPAYVQIDGGYSLVDAKYKKFVGPDAVSGENRDFAGNTLQLAPRHSGNVWLRGLLSDKIRAGIGARFMGRQWADDQNRFRMPSYALLDASLSFGSEHATFTISANNLLNRTNYVNSVINSGSPQIQVSPGAGREILGTLRLVL